METADAAWGLFRKTDGQPMRFVLDTDSIPSAVRMELAKVIHQEQGTTKKMSTFEPDYIVGQPYRHDGRSLRLLSRRWTKPILMPEWIKRCIKLGRIVGEEDDWGGFLIPLRGEDEEIDDDEESEYVGAENSKFEQDNPRSPSFADPLRVFHSSQPPQNGPGSSNVAKGKNVVREYKKERSPSVVALEHPPAAFSGNVPSATEETSFASAPAPAAEQSQPTQGPTMPMSADMGAYPNYMMNPSFQPLPPWTTVPTYQYIHPSGTMMAGSSNLGFSQMCPVVPLNLLPPDLLANILHVSASSNSVGVPGTSAGNAPGVKDSTSHEAHTGPNYGRAAQTLHTPPPSSSRQIPSLSTQTQRNTKDLFVPSTGVPLAFFIPTEVNGRVELCRAIKDHGGIVKTNMQHCDYVLLTPSEVPSVCPVALSRKKPLLHTWWIDRCIKDDHLAPLQGYDLTPFEQNASNITRPSGRAVSVSSQLSSDASDLLIVDSTQRHPQASSSTSRQRFKLPKAPRRTLRLPTGNRYTTEDEAYFIEFAKVKLAQDPRLSMLQLIREIARTTPQHSFASWKRHYQRKKQIFTKAIGTSMRSMSVVPSSEADEREEDEPEEDEDELDEDDDELEGTDDDEAARRYDLRRPRRQDAGTTAASSHGRAPMGKDGSTTIAKTAKVRGAGTASTHQFDKLQKKFDDTLHLPKSITYTATDFHNVVKHIAESTAPDEEHITYGSIWESFYKNHPGHTPGAWAEYVRVRRPAVVKAVKHYRQGILLIPCDLPEETTNNRVSNVGSTSRPVSSVGRSGGSGKLYVDQDLEDVCEFLWKTYGKRQPEKLTSSSIWTDFAETHTVRTQKGWVEYARRKDKQIRAALAEHKAGDFISDQDNHHKRQSSFELSDESPVSKRRKA